MSPSVIFLVQFIGLTGLWVSIGVTCGPHSYAILWQFILIDEETHCNDTKVGQVVASASDSPLTSASQ